jgi:hypothetical protein
MLNQKTTLVRDRCNENLCACHNHDEQRQTDAVNEGQEQRKDIKQYRKEMIKKLKCTLENFVIGQSVMTTDENIELRDCYNAEEDKNAAAETNASVAYGRVRFC